jgi:hypothetical protein
MHLRHTHGLRIMLGYLNRSENYLGRRGSATPQAVRLFRTRGAKNVSGPGGEMIILGITALAELDGFGVLCGTKNWGRGSWRQRLYLGR